MTQYLYVPDFLYTRTKQLGGSCLIVASIFYNEYKRNGNPFNFTNKDLARFLKINERNMFEVMSRLKKFKFIEVEIENYNTRKISWIYQE